MCVFTARCYAECGIACYTASRYVRPSVTLRYRDQIGYNSRLIGLGCSLSADLNTVIYTKGKIQNFVRNKGGYGNEWLSTCKSYNICETQDSTKVTLDDQYEVL